MEDQVSCIDEFVRVTKHDSIPSGHFFSSDFREYILYVPPIQTGVPRHDALLVAGSAGHTGCVGATLLFTTVASALSTQRFL